MAGDWIPMRTDLDEDPAVVGMASILNVPETQVIGWLWKLWSIASKQSVNGWLPHYTLQKIDGLVSHSGFAAALESVAWLHRRPGGIEIPNFGHWLSQSAKRRLQEARKKRLQRSRDGPGFSVPILSPPFGDKNGTPFTVLSEEKSLGKKEGCGEKEGGAREIAREWIFYFRGTQRSQREPDTLHGFFQAMIDAGIEPKAILGRIRAVKANGGDRDQTEETWKLRDWFAKQRGSAPGIRERLERIYAQQNGARP